MSEDQVIDRIREVRRQISEECGHDPHRLVEYYKKLQQQHQDRMLRSEGDEVGVDDLIKA